MTKRVVSIILLLAAFDLTSLAFQQYLSRSHHKINAFMAIPGEIVETRQVKGLQEGMKMRRIPNTDLVVSELSLGTMMYGEQISKDDAFDQMDLATARYGINFLNTAESFPMPMAESTTGRTEKIIGQWMKKKKIDRSSIVIATKVCGYSNEVTWCRSNEQPTRINREQIFEAVDNQLKRLDTDYIDILQLHWPERYVPMMGAGEYSYDLERDDITPIKDQLEIMDELIKSGKVRQFGLCNESPYGATSFVNTATLLGLPRPCSVEAPYNLIYRNDFETGMQEVCATANCNLGLFAVSPLAGGSLSGKYLDPSTVPMEARLRKYVGFMTRYVSKPALDAVRAYKEVADKISLPLAPLALAWVYSRPFVTSTVIAATSASQLEDNVMSLNIPIDKEVAELVNSVHRKFVDPCKGSNPVVDPNLEYIDPSKLPWGAKDQDVDPELDVLISQRFNKM